MWRGGVDDLGLVTSERRSLKGLFALDTSEEIAIALGGVARLSAIMTALLGHEEEVIVIESCFNHMLNTFQICLRLQLLGYLYLIHSLRAKSVPVRLHPRYGEGDKRVSNEWILSLADLECDFRTNEAARTIVY